MTDPVFRRMSGSASFARSSPQSPEALAIVRKIVDAHDGRIDVRSRGGGGLCFQVKIPVTQASTIPELSDSQTQATHSDTYDALCSERHIVR